MGTIYKLLLAYIDFPSKRLDFVIKITENVINSCDTKLIRFHYVYKVYKNNVNANSLKKFSEICYEKNNISPIGIIQKLIYVFYMQNYLNTLTIYSVTAADSYQVGSDLVPDSAF